MKRCSRCLAYKHFDQFKKHTMLRSGLRPECRTCQREREGVKKPMARTLAESFFGWITPGLPTDVCWEWPGKRDRSGYGCLRAQMQHLRAHRVSYILYHGPIPDGLWVLHHCDNPPCCNPAHLWLGTNAENTADKMRKGRHRSLLGEANPISKITAENVAFIRAQRGKVSQESLAQMFNMTQTNIGAIQRGKSWKAQPNSSTAPSRVRRSNEKLTEEDVRELFRQRTLKTHRELAQQFGISPGYVHHILHFKKWRRLRLWDTVSAPLTTANPHFSQTEGTFS